MKSETKIVIGPKNSDMFLFIEHTIKDKEITLAKDGVGETELEDATNLWDIEHAKKVLAVIKNHREEFDEPEWVDSLCIFEVEIKTRKKEII